MNDQSQIEAKIIHLTPPQRFQVAHQLTKDRPAEPKTASPMPKSDELKVLTNNTTKIWAIRILSGTWLWVTLFLKRCTRIDKNLLIVYVALVLLLLQVFMVISRAEAGPQNRRIFNSEYHLSPLIAAGKPSTFWLDPKSTKPEPVGESNNTAEKPQQPVVNIKGFPNLPNRQAGVPWAPGSARLLSARAEGCFHLVQGEGECRGLQPKALSAHRPASDSKPYWHCRKARRNYQSWCRAVKPVSVVGNVYERSKMSASARQSLAPVNERGNHLPIVIAHITSDVSQIKPLITKSDNLIADREHTWSAQTFDHHYSRNAPPAVQIIERSSFTLPKNPPWQLRLAETCHGTHVKAAGAAAALFAYFFQLQGKSMTRGSETNIIAVSCPNPPELAYNQNNLIEVSLMQAYSFQISTSGNTESETLSSDIGHPSSLYSMNSLWVNRQRSAYPPLSGTGVPQMITSTGY